MPKTKRPAKKSSRLGRRNHKVPLPLRFKSVADAREHIKANKLKVTETHAHTRGAHIQVVDRQGKPRTISIEPPEKDADK